MRRRLDLPKPSGAWMVQPSDMRIGGLGREAPTSPKAGRFREAEGHIPASARAPNGHRGDGPPDFERRRLNGQRAGSTAVPGTV
jgi:hypothetical protein